MSHGRFAGSGDFRREIRQDFGHSNFTPSHRGSSNFNHFGSKPHPPPYHPPKRNHLNLEHLNPNETTVMVIDNLNGGRVLYLKERRKAEVEEISKSCKVRVEYDVQEFKGQPTKLRVRLYGQTVEEVQEAERRILLLLDDQPNGVHFDVRTVQHSYQPSRRGWSIAKRLIDQKQKENYFDKLDVHIRIPNIDTTKLTVKLAGTKPENLIRAASAVQECIDSVQESIIIKRINNANHFYKLKDAFLGNNAEKIKQIEAANVVVVDFVSNVKGKDQIVIAGDCSETTVDVGLLIDKEMKEAILSSYVRDLDADAENFLNTYESAIKEVPTDKASLETIITNTLQKMELMRKQVLKVANANAVRFDTRQAKAITETQTKVKYKTNHPDYGVVFEVRKAAMHIQKTDAIVNTANPKLNHMRGTAQSISLAGGPAVQTESDAFVRQNGKLNVGSTAVTNAGNLQCKKIIHAIPPRWRGGGQGEAHVLKGLIKLILVQSEKEQISSISIPTLGADSINGFPATEAVPIITQAIDKYFSKMRKAEAVQTKSSEGGEQDDQEHSEETNEKEYKGLKNIIFCEYEEEKSNIFAAALEKLFGPPNLPLVVTDGGD